jgi:hypothetical protein
MMSGPDGMIEELRKRPNTQRSTRPEANALIRGAKAMNSMSEIAVTLAPELFEHLKAEARQLGVSLEWLVASLVVDTMEKTKLELVPVPA